MVKTIEKSIRSHPCCTHTFFTCKELSNYIKMDRNNFSSIRVRFCFCIKCIPSIEIQFKCISDTASDILFHSIKIVKIRQNRKRNVTVFCLFQKEEFGYPDLRNNSDVDYLIQSQKNFGNS